MSSAIRLPTSGKIVLICWPDFPQRLELVLRAEAVQLLTLELGDLLAAGDRLGHGLAVEPGQLGLRIERLQVAHAAGHVEPDDPLGLGRAVQGMEDPPPAVVGAGGAVELTVEQSGQGERAEALGRTAQEGATGRGQAAIGGGHGLSSS